ncbi:DUF2953 domain-containing protein [Methanolobus sp. WCC4]|uniref:DUF2953 domain-containing protein n=1 Tax=Methanolobus sp. WCC4 TaxID=3125784 RepID=UPI0030FA27A3
MSRAAMPPVLTVILLLIVIAVLLVLIAAIDIIFEAHGSSVYVEHKVTAHWLIFSRVISPSQDEDETVDEGIPDDVKEAERFVTERVTSYFQGTDEEVKKKKKMDMSFSEALQAFRQLRSPVVRLLKGIIFAMRVPYARINVTYGFPDPAYTGMVCGYACAVTGYLQTHPGNLDLQLEPDFMDSRLDVDMSGTVRIRLYRFIPVILMFILNRNVLRFSWKYLGSRRSKGGSKISEGSGVNL